MADDAPAADTAVDTPAAAPTESASPASIAAPAKVVRAKAVRLHVQELGADMTSEALLALFTPHGTVKGGEVKAAPDGKCRGVGFVIMSTEDEATKAIAELHGTKQGEKSLNVFRAPENKEKGKEKGEGKGKLNGKGKGQAQVAAFAMQQQQQQAFAMNPYPYGYVDPAYAMMDPAMMQMMQQMYMTQLYASQMQPSEQKPSGKGAGEKGKGNGKGKEKGKKKEKGDGGATAKTTAVEGTFTGTLKSINPVAGKGYGFIQCAEIMESYSRDVFVGTEMVPTGAKVGDKLQFNVALSEKGQPRAANVINIP